MEHNAPTSTPRIVAGIVILSMSNKVMSNPASRPSSATVAAEMGLAVMACCEAMTAIPSGRSGLILVSVATSAMNRVCHVSCTGYESNQVGDDGAEDSNLRRVLAQQFFR